MRISWIVVIVMEAYLSHRGGTIVSRRRDDFPIAEEQLSHGGETAASAKLSMIAYGFRGLLQLKPIPIPLQTSFPIHFSYSLYFSYFSLWRSPLGRFVGNEVSNCCTITNYRERQGNLRIEKLCRHAPPCHNPMKIYRKTFYIFINN